jgi:alkaline ceramidase
MSKMFSYHSSDVDWCETNYEVSNYIVEFYNTISNIPFVVIPSVVLYYYMDFFKKINGGAIVLLFGLLIVGVSSMYFHATLSFAGQLMDELTILYFIIAMFWYYHGRIYNITFLLCIILGTLLCFIEPSLNAFGLLSISIPGIWTLWKEIRDGVEKLLFIATILFGSCGFVCWIIDKFFCHIWNTPRGYWQFHAWWHILVFIAASTCVLFLIKINNRRKHIYLNLHTLKLIIIHKNN